MKHTFFYDKLTIYIPIIISHRMYVLKQVLQGAIGNPAS